MPSNEQVKSSCATNLSVPSGRCHLISSGSTIQVDRTTPRHPLYEPHQTGVGSDLSLRKPRLCISKSERRSLFAGAHGLPWRALKWLERAAARRFRRRLENRAGASAPSRRERVNILRTSGWQANEGGLRDRGVRVRGSRVGVVARLSAPRGRLGNVARAWRAGSLGSTRGVIVSRTMAS